MMTTIMTEQAPLVHANVTKQDQNTRTAAEALASTSAVNDRSEDAAAVRLQKLFRRRKAHQLTMQQILDRFQRVYDPNTKR